MFRTLLKKVGWGKPSHRSRYSDRVPGGRARCSFEALEGRMMFSVDVGQLALGTTNYLNGGLRNVGETILSDPNARSLYNAVFDPTTGYALFTTAGAVNPAEIIKVNLNGSLPVVVGTVNVAHGQMNLISGAIDISDPNPANHYAYFGDTNQPGQIIKVKMGLGDAPPVVLGSINLNSSAGFEGSVFGAVIDNTSADPAKHYGYFAVNSSAGNPARIVKVALGVGDALPTEVGSISLLSGETSVRRAMIDTSDPLNHYAYFAAQASSNGSSYLVKVKLGDGANFKVLGAAALQSDELPIGSAVLDVKNHYAYLGTYNPGQSQAKVVMVSTGVGDAAPTRVGAVALPAGQRELSTAVIDYADGYALFGSDHTYPANVYKIKLASGGVLPTEAGVLSLKPGTSAYPVANGGNIVNADPVKYGEIYLQSSVIDLAHGYAYFGTDTTPGQIVKVATSEMGAIHGMKITLGTSGILDSMHFYSQGAGGNIRLAIYDASKHLVWQSSTIANTTANTWLVAPAATANVQLAAGTYYLAFQQDTQASVASYTPGAAGDGFTFEQGFGAFTTALAATTSTSERWSMYLTYHQPGAAPAASALPSDQVWSSLNLSPPASSSSSPASSTVSATVMNSSSSSPTASAATAPTATAPAAAVSSPASASSTSGSSAANSSASSSTTKSATTTSTSTKPATTKLTALTTDSTVV